MRHRIDRDTAKKSTPQVNNAKPTKAKLTLHKKIFSKDAVALPTDSFSASYHTKSHPTVPIIALTVPVDKALVTVPLKDDLLTYQLQRMITTQLQRVRRSMC